MADTRLNAEGGGTRTASVQRSLAENAAILVRQSRLILRKILPARIRRWLRRILYPVMTKLLVTTLNICDYNVSRSRDYYSPLPVVSKLRENTHRWFRPSELVGLQFDLEGMKQLLLHLQAEYAAEFNLLPDYSKNQKRQFGPGFPAIDAMLLYFMMRHLKPRRLVEVGSGLSTYYCSVAAKRNREEGRPLAMTCIDPDPYEALYRIPFVSIIKKEVQDVEFSTFQELDSGDVLFIDSTHIVKIDGDVPYLYLEVLPRLKKGTFIHLHDVPFPYNVPYPPQLWIFERLWPVFWNEAMLLQAFLSYNDAYETVMSVPLLRYYKEEFLRQEISRYVELAQLNEDVCSSIWIHKVE
jgi:predicted O-methyltransferase YrrM